ncbi:hypothetical protein XPA_003996 [Xanthoria parietina]
MFHRRRASSNPPAKAPPTAAASTAAVQAFLASRASQANLSSAAAAAALRSRPTTPTPVGDLPTRRRAQRSGSVSSNGSSRPNLQRQNSAGSMTERTFRDPSPSRPNPEYLYQDDPPPGACSAQRLCVASPAFCKVDTTTCKCRASRKSHFACTKSWRAGCQFG